MRRIPGSVVVLVLAAVSMFSFAGRPAYAQTLGSVDGVVTDVSGGTVQGGGP
jgi:hypothetical protein